MRDVSTCRTAVTCGCCWLVCAPRPVGSSERPFEAFPAPWVLPTRLLDKGLEEESKMQVGEENTNHPSTRYLSLPSSTIKCSRSHPGHGGDLFWDFAWQNGSDSPNLIQSNPGLLEMAIQSSIIHAARGRRSSGVQRSSADRNRVPDLSIDSHRDHEGHYAV